jgi:serine/threonine-protein kinase HipA
MNDRRCVICLRPVGAEGGRYHKDCCRRLFNSPQVPVLPYAWEEMNKLAEEVVRQHVTVPGVQPKLSLHLEHEHGRSGRLTLVGMEGDYVLKPPVARYREMPELEHLTMRMARACGLDTCTCGLIALEDGQWAYIARRMDRPDGGKLHMEDMCQLTDRLTERKYSGSMEQVGKAILKRCDYALFDVLRFFELSLFCFLTGNADMHLKNFSLIYGTKQEIRLSPAYDLLPTLLFIPEDTEETALTINGKKRRLTRKDFQVFGEQLRLADKQVENAFDRIAEKLHDTLDLVQYGFCSGKTKERYCDLIKDRAARLDMSL